MGYTGRYTAHFLKDIIMDCPMAEFEQVFSVW